MGDVAAGWGGLAGRPFDLCWLMFVGVVSTAVLQCVAIAVAIFPRWVGLFNVWTAIILTLGGVIVCFKSGPLAWNGIFTSWIPLSVFTAWFG